MLIDITKIKTKNRIRKDFGNIQELADDIKQNGLINPPVVIAETDGTFTLLAGERRLRAMKSLGYRQVEVRTWGSLTDEQKLNIEISENEVRKDFSKAERVEYARRLEKIESIKAKERQATSTGGANPQLVQNFAEADANKTRNIVAEKLGIGSGETYRKEKYIVDNADTLTPEDFADWDEGKLSTNKAYLKIKEQLAEKENQIAGYEAKMKRVDELKAKIQGLEKELANRPVETVEVKPADYDKIIHDNSEMIKDNTRLTKQYGEKCAELVKLKEQLKTIVESQAKNKHQTKVIDDSIFFCERIDRFIKEVGGYAYLGDYINDLPDKEKSNYIRAAELVKAWAENILLSIN